MNDIKRLTEIAQTLDEMSDETPELSALAEEMGALIDSVEASITRLEEVVHNVRREDSTPRYLREIQSIVQNEIARNRGMYPTTPRDQWLYEQYNRNLNHPLSPPHRMAGNTVV